ncbi:hypothetical protein M407DRAFT_244338 [Tulasnella calospora MUT 4182]|uniref:Uncharacterized protein n=1 Tax=Tulasnella calospora MUT 4182 TaxID=1051891 RepID=A0A0C3LTN6_9AGAM|nr:hypothetical protein M407DRAFT_244338 [Tulasnella calospora MUT 4182]
MAFILQGGTKPSDRASSLDETRVAWKTSKRRRRVSCGQEISGPEINEETSAPDCRCGLRSSEFEYERSVVSA